jgi:hypothetical protein
MCNSLQHVYHNLKTQLKQANLNIRCATSSPIFTFNQHKVPIIIVTISNSNEEPKQKPSQSSVVKKYNSCV